MNPAQENSTVQTFQFVREEQINAPIEVVFEAVLAELGPESQKGDGAPMPMKLEAWPGGRWFRDLGNNTGHLWGHVQVINAPKLIELNGPMFMSFPASNHVQYKLTADGKGTKLSFIHRSMGLIPKELMEGMNMGWGYKLNRVKEIALKRASH